MITDLNTIKVQPEAAVEQGGQGVEERQRGAGMERRVERQRDRWPKAVMAAMTMRMMTLTKEAALCRLTNRRTLLVHCD